MKKYEIAPSILSANFVNLSQELSKCQQVGIKWLHYDVMDYDFVPNLTFGAKILQDIVNVFDFKIDIHFMVKVKTKPFVDFFAEFLKAKPEMMTMHIEALEISEIQTFIELCKKNNIKASLAIKPSTKIDVLFDYLPSLDNILVMTVEPGFGGQLFIKEAATKIGELKKMAKTNKYHYTVEADGGINNQTIKIVKEQNVDLIVVGSYLFGHQDFEEHLKRLNND